MTNPFTIFKIRREERWLAVAALIVFSGLYLLLISSQWNFYTKGASMGFWSLFARHFTVSGYDCWSWITLSEGRVLFHTTRHPLYLSFLYPMYWLNSWLMQQTGFNFAVFFIGAVLAFVIVYSTVFLFRISHEIIGVSRRESLLLTALLFSLAHVMLAIFVPDHFAISMFLLLMTLYITGKCLQKGIALKAWQLATLAFFTCGMATSDVLKTFLAGLATNGKRFFRLRFMLVGVWLPLVLLLAIQRYQYYSIEVSLNEKTQRVIKSNQPKDKVAHARKVAAYKKWRDENDMKPAGKGIFKLMDFETSRVKTLVHNFFGESLQLHEDYLLQDNLISRPIFVEYRHAHAYVVEGILVLLFSLGVVLGWRHHFLKMALLWFCCDFLLHIVLGFAINEVYIMTAGWAFIIPIAVGFMLKALSGKMRTAINSVLVVLTLYLWIHNLSLVIGYFV